MGLRNHLYCHACVDENPLTYSNPYGERTVFLAHFLETVALRPNKDLQGSRS